MNDLKRKRRAKQKKLEHNKSKLGVRGRDPLHVRRAQDAIHAGLKENNGEASIVPSQQTNIKSIRERTFEW